MLPSGGIVGWDLGGAHLKVAVLDTDRRLLWVAQRPTPLWQGLDHLDGALRELGRRFDFDGFEHALTMTGELVDLFKSRVEGVAELTAFVAERLPAGSLRLYAGPLGFVDVAGARAAHASIASANWYATAAWLASTGRQGILIDIGSTSTDLLPLHTGSVRNRGYSDRERLACEELVYSGIVRTPVMAVVQRVPFAGEWLSLANEHFATMADVYRILGQLPYGADQYPSADGRDHSVRSSMRRLARMVGADLGDADARDWHRLAAFIADFQLNSFATACWRHISHWPADDVRLFGAGVGKSLVWRLAQRLRLEFVDADSLFGRPAMGETSAATCAPAVAVAQLAAMQRLACAC